MINLKFLGYLWLSQKSCFRKFSCTARSWAILDPSSEMPRHSRYRAKMGDDLPPPSVIELVVVGCGRGGTPKSVMVNTSYFRYLFNCGEGTQRIATEHKMKVSRIEHVFVTHSSWNNIGGLMGFCLTSETAGATRITIHGPPQAESHVSSARSFAQLRSLELVKRELSEGDFVDSAMKIESVPIYSSESRCTEEEEANKMTSGESAPKKQRMSESSEDHSMAVVYVCKPHPKPRSLSLEKCVDHNVPAGPLMGRLKNCEEVTLADGSLVKPDDVLFPAEPNNPFIVVECPTMDFLESLVTNRSLGRYQAVNENETELPATFIVHLTPPAVFTSDAYQAWMSRFGDKTRHLVVNEHGSELAHEVTYANQAKFNLVHRGIFPLLPHQQTPSSYEKIGTDTESVVYAETNLRYIIRGQTPESYNRERCLTINNELYTKEALAQSEFCDALKDVRCYLDSQSSGSSVLKSAYPELIFLGTGSTMPNKARNVSAIWLNLSNEASMLLDCGESTFGQICRHFGSDAVVDALRSLRAVFVSHLHADHHLGIIGLAVERHRLLKQSGSDAVEPLTVLATWPLDKWYSTISTSLIPMKSLVRIVPMESLYPSRREQYKDEYAKLTESLGVSQLQAVRMEHRQHPHGIVLKHSDGWKLAYSGDTMPCENFIAAGQGCDVVIHEATMDDDLADDAMAKKHSTTSQAIDVGLRMGAEFILLTHFSQRYPKVPIFNSNFSSRVGIAFDNMRVRLCDLPLLPQLNPALKTVFADDYYEMEEKGIRKKRRKLMKAEEDAMRETKSAVGIGSQTEPEKKQELPGVNSTPSTAAVRS